MGSGEEEEWGGGRVGSGEEEEWGVGRRKSGIPVQVTGMMDTFAAALMIGMISCSMSSLLNNEDMAAQASTANSLTESYTGHKLLLRQSQPISGGIRGH